MTCLHPSQLSSTSVDSLSNDPAVLKAEIARLRAHIVQEEGQRAQLLRVSSSAVKALQARQDHPEEEGIWISEEDVDLLDEIARSLKEEGARGDVWVWTKVSLGFLSVVFLSSPPRRYLSRSK